MAVWLPILTIAWLLALSTAALAQGSPMVIRPDLAQSEYAGEVVVPIHKSRILRSEEPFTELHVGDPEIADVLALTDRSMYVLGKKTGATSLTVYGKNKSLQAVVDLTVTYDIEGLKRGLFDLVKGEKVEVRPANRSIVLSGTVSSSEQLARIMEVSQRYAPDSVTNLITVAGSQQVMLAVRFAELKRTAAKELGLNTQWDITSGDVAFQLLTGLGAAASRFGSAALTIGDLDLLLDALEEKRVLKTLAEPNLIALSGESASFLAGGEFPIPVVQSTGTAGAAPAISIEYKEFGVRLSFTPTVLGNDVINLVVEPEVSAIDPTSSVVLSGFDIPGLTTRRARTTVDLKDGQSFAIAGLLQSNFQGNIQQFPFLGDIPVLGALFRSSDYQRNETELVIIVTPYKVKPARPGDLVLPTDSFTPPSDSDFFLQGMTDAATSGPRGKGASSSTEVESHGGLDGNIGHIVR
jgi:pilus assembly protein CpaC